VPELLPDEDLRRRLAENAALTDLERTCLALLAEQQYATTVVRNAWWRTLYTEHHGTDLNRWLLAAPRLI